MGADCLEGFSVDTEARGLGPAAPGGQEGANPGDPEPRRAMWETAGCLPSSTAERGVSSVQLVCSPAASASQGAGSLGRFSRTRQWEKGCGFWSQKNLSSNSSRIIFWSETLDA